MEYVSVLAGEPFTDHPRCTHRALGGIARRVNDTISDTARPRLALLAPDLIGTNRGSARIVPALVVSSVRIALEVRPFSRRLWRWRRRAEKHLNRLEHGSGLPASLRVPYSWALWSAVRTVATSSRQDRDELLTRLLADGIASARGDRELHTQSSALSCDRADRSQPQLTAT